MGNQRRPRSDGDFVAPDAKAKSSGAESAVSSSLTDPDSRPRARYFAPRSTTVGLGPSRADFRLFDIAQGHLSEFDLTVRSVSVLYGPFREATPERTRCRRVRP